MSSLFDYLKKLNIPYKDEKLYITATTHASMNNLTNADSYSDYSSLSIIGTQILNATNMKILYEKNYKLKHKDLLNENRSFVIQDNIGKIAEQEGIVNFIRINDYLNMFKFYLKLPRGLSTYEEAKKIRRYLEKINVI